MINLGRGFSKKDDTLPDRMLHDAAPCGPAEGKVVELEPMLAEYYRFRGWSKDGIPTERKLSELGLREYGRQLLPC